MAGIKACYDCVKAFSETDFTVDLKKMDIPTLFIQGDDDQIVPYQDASVLAVKLVPNGRLEIYKGAPHGLPSTLKDRSNADLLAFFGTPVAASNRP
jgi:non-heme chloroperoxidase